MERCSVTWQNRETGRWTQQSGEPCSQAGSAEAPTKARLECTPDTCGSATGLKACSLTDSFPPTRTAERYPGLTPAEDWQLTLWGHWTHDTESRDARHYRGLEATLKRGLTEGLYPTHETHSSFLIVLLGLWQDSLPQAWEQSLPAEEFTIPREKESTNFRNQTSSTYFMRFFQIKGLLATEKSFPCIERFQSAFSASLLIHQATKGCLKLEESCGMKRGDQTNQDRS